MAEIRVVGSPNPVALNYLLWLVAEHVYRKELAAAEELRCQDGETAAKDADKQKRLNNSLQQPGEPG